MKFSRVKKKCPFLTLITQLFLPSSLLDHTTTLHTAVLQGDGWPHPPLQALLTPIFFSLLALAQCCSLNEQHSRAFFPYPYPSSWLLQEMSAEIPFLSWKVNLP